VKDNTKANISIFMIYLFFLIGLSVGYYWCLAIFTNIPKDDIWFLTKVYSIAVGVCFLIGEISMRFTRGGF